MQTTNTDVFQKQKEKIQDTSYLFFLIAAVAGVCAILQNFCFIYIGEKVSARIRRELFKSITMQEIGFFDQNSVSVGCLDSGFFLSRLLLTFSIVHITDR